MILELVVHVLILCFVKHKGVKPSILHAQNRRSSAAAINVASECLILSCGELD